MNLERRSTSPKLVLAAAGLSTFLASGLVTPLSPVAMAADGSGVPSDGVFVIDGHGSGHGHGLSQWGARAAASSGACSGPGTGCSANQILDAYYPGTYTSTIADSPVRVQLTSVPSSGLVVVASSGLTVSEDDGASVRSAALDGSVSRWRVVRAGTGKATLSRWLPTATWSDPVTLPSGATSTAAVLRFSTNTAVVGVVMASGNTVSYRGTVEVASGTRFTVINRLGMESYLRSVVPAEMPGSWAADNGGRGLAAVQAQAIAARSYAAYQRRARASNGYDLVDNANDQAYGGISAESACKAGSITCGDYAVSSTSGNVRSFGGNPIYAQYCSSNGGWTVAGSMPYLNAHRDDWDGLFSNRVHSWTVRVSVAAIQSAYYADGLRRLTGLAITSRNGNGEWGGRVLGFRILGDTVSGRPIDTNGDDFASRLDLPSNWFTLPGSVPAAPIPYATTANAAVRVSWILNDPGTAPVDSFQVTVQPGGRSFTTAASAHSVLVGSLTNGVSYSFTVRAHSAVGWSPWSDPMTAIPDYGLVTYHPLPGARLVSPRTPTPARGRLAVALAAAGVPASATAVDVDTSVLHAATSGSLFAGPGGGRLNRILTWVPGQSTAAHATVPVKRGSLSLAAAGARVALDVVGYWSPDPMGSLAVPAGHAITLADSTRGIAVAKGGLLANRELRLPVAGTGGVPVEATAVRIAVRTWGQKSLTTLTAWPTGRTRPGTWQQVVDPKSGGQAATTVVALGSSGALSLRSTSAIGVSVVVVGWYGPAEVAARAAGSGRLVARTAITLLDSRAGAGATGPLRAGSRVNVPLPGTDSVPGTARSVVLAVTVQGTAGKPAAAKVWPSGLRVPASAGVVSSTNRPQVGYLVVPPGRGRAVAVSVSATAQVRIDLVGWIGTAT